MVFSKFYRLHSRSFRKFLAIKPLLYKHHIQLTYSMFYELNSVNTHYIKMVFMCGQNWTQPNKVITCAQETQDRTNQDGKGDKLSVCDSELSKNTTTKNVWRKSHIKALKLFFPKNKTTLIFWLVLSIASVTASTEQRNKSIIVGYVRCSHIIML